MIDPGAIDDLTGRIAGALPVDVRLLGEDLKKNIRMALSAGLARMDLVSREEFEVQAALLARTREKLDRLEARVASLERPVD